MILEVFRHLTLLSFIASTDIVNSDFLQRLQHECSDPNANVGRDNMHETETSEYLEAVNVQLEWKEG